MKKHYDTTRIIDDLSKSVFFQEPEQPLEQQEKHQSTLALKHQVTKAPEIQSAKALHIQPTKDTKQESTKAGSNQSAQTPLQQLNI